MRRLLAWMPLVLLAACGTGVPSSVPVSGELAALVPPDTVFLAGSPIDEIRDTPMFDQLVVAGLPEQAYQLFRDSGLDPTKDLDELLYAHNSNDGLLLVRGNLANLTVTGPRHEVSGRTIIVSPAGIDSPAGGVMLWDSQVVLLGPTDLLEKVAANHDSFTGIPAPLRQRIDNIDYGNHIWAVSIGGWMPSTPAGNLGNLLALGNRVAGLTIAASFLQGMHVLIDADCRTPPDADGLEASVRTMLGLARISLNGEEGAQALLESVAVLRNDKNVKITAELAPELLTEFLQESPVETER